MCCWCGSTRHTGGQTRSGLRGRSPITAVGGWRVILNELRSAEAISWHVKPYSPNNTWRVVSVILLSQTTNFKFDKTAHFTHMEIMRCFPVTPHNTCILLKRKCIHHSIWLRRRTRTRTRLNLHHGVQTRGEKAALPGCAKEKEERAADSQLHSSSSHTQDPDARLHWVGEGFCMEVH